MWRLRSASAKRSERSTTASVLYVLVAISASLERVPGNPGGAFCVVTQMARIQVYTTRWCGYCVRAKALLNGRGIPYEEISLDDVPEFRRLLMDTTGGWTVP